MTTDIDDDDERLDPIYYRSPAVVADTLRFIYSLESVPWAELVGRVLELHRNKNTRTIENVIYDLIAHGAAHKVGKYQRGSDTRAVRATPLGRAWIMRELLPLVGEKPDVDQID